MEHLVPYDHDFRRLSGQESASAGFSPEVFQTFRCKKCRLVFANADGEVSEADVNDNMRYTVCGRMKLNDPDQSA